MRRRSLSLTLPVLALTVVGCQRPATPTAPGQILGAISHSPIVAGPAQAQAAGGALSCFDGTYTSEERHGDFIHVENVVVSGGTATGRHTFTDGTVSGSFEWSGTLTVGADQTRATITGEGTIYNAGTRSFTLERGEVSVSETGTAVLFWGGTDPLFGPIGGVAHRSAISQCGAANDTTAPVIASVTPSVSDLWPANGRMVSVTFAAVATDAVSTPACSITSISSNEPVAGLGGTDRSPDWTFSGLVAELRAERSARGDGRIYTVQVTCADAAGNTSSKDAFVTVPHDQRK